MKLVVPTAVALSVPAGILLISTFQTRKWIRKDALFVLIAGAVIGVTLGTYVLASFGSDLLKRLFGIFLIIYALKSLFERKNGKKEINNYVGLIAGFVGGCLGGMFGSGGPPIIMFLNRKIEDKRAFRATLTLYFLVANSWQFITFSCARLIDMDVLKFALYLLPAFIAGNLIGSILHVKINQVLFHRVVALVLLAAGIFLIIPRPSPDAGENLAKIRFVDTIDENPELLLKH